MSRAVIGLTSLALIVGATTAAPVPTHLMPKGAPLYFPTRVGAKWVWVYKGSEGVFGAAESTWTFSVTAVESTDAGCLVTVMRHESDDKKVPYQKVLVTRAGLEDIMTGDSKLTSPQRLLHVPSAAGTKSDVDYSCKEFTRKGHRTLIGTEEVRVPAGKFTAKRVRSTYAMEFAGEPALRSQYSVDTWYAPGVGVVQMQHSNDEARPYMLQSFTP